MKMLTLLLLGLLTSALFAQELVSKKENSGIEWGVYVDATGNAGVSGIGITPSVFIPIKPSEKDIVIIDLRGTIADRNSNASLAVGYRRRINDKMAWGANGGIDLIGSGNGNPLAQASLGIEFFSEYVDVAMNFYAPLTGWKDIEGTAIAPFARIDDNELMLLYSDNAQERTRYGMDMVVSAQFPLEENVMLNVDGGMAIFFGGENYKPVVGVSAAAELEIGVDMGEKMDGTFTMGTELSYNGQSGWDFQVTLGFGVSFGPIRKSDGRGDYVYDEYQGMKKSAPSVATVEAKDRMHIENATTIIDGEEYHFVYEGDANTDIVAMVDGSVEDALVVLNGDNGDINITSDIQLKDGQYVIGEGRAIVVTGPEGRTAVLLIGGERATVNQENSEENIFTLAANNTINGVNLVGGNNAIFVDAGNDAKIINVNIDGSQTGINADDAGVVTIADANIQAVGVGVLTSKTEKVVILNSNLSSIQSSDDEDYEIGGTDVTGPAIISASSTTIVDSNFGSTLEIQNGSGDVQLLNVVGEDELKIDSVGNVILNGVTFSGNADIKSTGASVDISNFDFGGDVIVSAKYAATMLNGMVSGNLNVTSEMDSIILEALTIGGDLIATANRVNAFMVTVGGDIYVIGASYIELNQVTTGTATVTMENTNIDTDAELWIDGELQEWIDTDGDGVTDHLDVCPLDANEEPIPYYVDNDEDGLGFGASVGEICRSDIPNKHADNNNDGADNDRDNDGIPYYHDSNDNLVAEQRIEVGCDIRYTSTGSPTFSCAERRINASSQVGNIWTEVAWNGYLDASGVYALTMYFSNYVNPNYYEARVEIEMSKFNEDTYQFVEVLKNGYFSFLPDYNRSYDYSFNIWDSSFTESCQDPNTATWMRCRYLYSKFSIILEKK